jgi:DNA/RNA endonuclease YhcR with UshA esterase domain
MKKFLIVISLTIVSLGNISAQQVTLDEVKNHVGTGSPVTVCGKIYGGKYLESAVNTPTLLDMGANYPNQLLTLVIFGENLNAFPKSPEAYFLNKDVCVTGQVIDYNGKPEIVLRSPEQIQLNTGSAANTSVPKRETPKIASPSKTAPATKSSTNPKTASTTSASKTSTSATSSSQDDITLSGDVYMRSGPSFDYPIISTVKAGTVVGVLFSNNGWSQVVIRGGNSKNVAEGYIKNNVLK